VIQIKGISKTSEKILDKGANTMQEKHDDVIRQKKLPRVGQIVCSKKYGTLWRVIEKKEVWQNIADDPKTGAPRLLPAIHLTYGKINQGEPAIGRKLGYAYTLHDTTFESNWEIVP
jgi:hypothetical protein